MKKDHETSSWAEFRALFSPARTAKNEAGAKRKLRLMDLRKGRGVTQAELAAAVRMGQGAVSKLERQTDARLSRLQEYARALGIDIELYARVDGELFPLALGDEEKKTPTRRAVARARSAR